MNFSKEQIDFVQSVYEMRKLQKNGFKTANQERAQMRKQSYIDAQLAEFLKAGIIKDTDKRVDQANLF